MRHLAIDRHANTQGTPVPFYPLLIPLHSAPSRVLPPAVHPQEVFNTALAETDGIRTFSAYHDFLLF